MADLKKCPFCGGYAEMKTSYNVSRGFYYTQAKCAICAAQGPAARSTSAPDLENAEDRAVDYAAMKWNRRDYNE